MLLSSHTNMSFPVVEMVTICPNHHGRSRKVHIGDIIQGTAWLVFKLSVKTDLMSNSHKEYSPGAVRNRDPPTSATQVLGLKTCTTTPSIKMRFIFNVHRSIWCNILKISLITLSSVAGARLIYTHHLEGTGSDAPPGRSSI